MIASLRRRKFNQQSSTKTIAPQRGSEDIESLDLSFYRRRYPDLAAYDEEGLRVHWTQHGRSEGRAPDALTAVREHPKFKFLPNDFRPYDYVAINHDLDKSYHDPTYATLHYLDYGLDEGRKYLVSLIDASFESDYFAVYQATKQEESYLEWFPRSAEAFLYLAGFTDIRFLEVFDYEFYYVLAALSSDIAMQNACIFHFAETGAALMLPIAPDLCFDPSFYKTHTNGSRNIGATVSNAELYRRWLSQADFKAAPTNHTMLMKDRFGVACGLNDVINPDTYRQANRDLKSLNDETLLEHVFSDGLFEQRSSIRIKPSNIAIFTRYADHLLAVGDARNAEDLYRRLAHFVPNNSRLNQQFGDMLYRQSAFENAYLYYRRNIEAGTASKWCYLNAATCCERLGDLGTARKIMTTAGAVYPEDQNVLGVRNNVMERFFEDEYVLARAEALADEIPEAQSRIYDAVRCCSFEPESVAPARPIRSVALFVNTDLAQCTLYRVEQKAEQLVAAGYAVRIYECNEDRAAFLRDLSEHDAVIFYRVAAFPGICRTINTARAAGLVTFYEIDDLIFDPLHFPEPFEDYADQITREEYVDVATGVTLFRAAIELCDFAIASTPLLAELMRPLVRRREAFVHRNAIGQRHEQAMASHHAVAPGRTDGPVTIFYGSGTKAHKLDFSRILLPALEEIDRRFGSGVRIVIMGHKPKDGHSPVWSRVHFVPFTNNVESYWEQLSSADISLSVLRKTPSTSAKSEIKWLEAAMFGIPSVVSATQTFEEVIDDGVDGFLAANTAEFIEKIDALVRHPAKRQAMGAAAKAKAIGNYAVDVMATNLRTIFTSTSTSVSERTRVLLVNVFYAPQAKGGATRVMIDNIRDLRQLYPDDFEFEVFTTLEGARDPYSVHVTAFDSVRVTAMVAGDYPEVDLEPVDWRAGAIFRRCVERFRPQMIHFHCIQRITAAATEIALELGIPYFITVHDAWWISDKQFLFDGKKATPTYDFNKPAGWRPKVPGARYDRPQKLVASLRGAEAVLAVSDAFAALYASTGLDNVRSVPNGASPLEQPGPPRPGAGQGQPIAQGSARAHRWSRAA